MKKLLYLVFLMILFSSLSLSQSKKELKVWSKYDFVAGDKIIFEDDLAYEQNGEFPSRWDIYSGNVENAQLGDENVIMFRDDSYIMPFLENAESAYLPEVFTLEFDCYFNLGENYQDYAVLFYDKLNQSPIEISELRIYWNKAIMSKFEGSYPGSSASSYSDIEGWRHISISFNKRSLKVYLDDTRLLNVPNLKIKPTGISIWGDFNRHIGKYSYIKNIRIAEGGVELYDKLMTDGKIVTTGIRFNVNKSTIKPESMGIINKIAELMNENSDVNFRIDGHTDSDGDEAFNQKLSEERAASVKNALVDLGIDASRLETKGFGESNPVDENSTPEGKANNRRVEFIKI